jgi:hypothetical protein
MKTEEKLQLYAVYILKRDNSHITAIETKSFDEAHNLWKELRDKWTKAIKETLPFELSKPIITAFDPGLIYEITLKPVIEITDTINPNNPYHQQMIKNGLSSTLNTSRGEIFDGGYK